MIVLPYSTVGIKAGVDFMLWRIGYDLDPFQRMAADINKSILGRYLDVPQSYLAMTKHSQYVDEHVHEGQEGRRLRIVPGKKPVPLRLSVREDARLVPAARCPSASGS